MKIISKDILTVESGVICQQVNCQGVMGSGLAKQIRDKWPKVYEEYRANYNSVGYDVLLLGRVTFTFISENLSVCNIFGQLNYGYDGKRYTDYGALKTAFDKIECSDFYEKELYFPYNFGCDRGGADWQIVSKMIDFYFPNAIICKL